MVWQVTMESAFVEGVSAMRAMLSVLAGVCVLGLPVLASAQPTIPPGNPPPQSGPGGPQGPSVPGGPGGPGAPTDPGAPTTPATATFQLKICNKASARVGDAYVSIISVVENGKQYRAQGWWRIPNAQCVDIGEFKRPGVFLHGIGCGGDCKWGSQKLVYCVNSGAGFDYSFAAGRECGTGEALAGFFPVEVDDRAPVETQNLTGG
jgi:hypothetical protein